MGQQRLAINWYTEKSFRNDTKEAHFPLLFWDHCIERNERIGNLTSKIIFNLLSTNDHTLLKYQTHANINGMIGVTSKETKRSCPSTGNSWAV